MIQINAQVIAQDTLCHQMWHKYLYQLVEISSIGVISSARGSEQEKERNSKDVVTPTQSKSKAIWKKP